MPTVPVSIGPAPAASARVWSAAAKRTVAVARRRPDLGVPDDVLDAFEAYLRSWEPAMAGEVFRWEGEVEVGVLRHLAAHWARLVTLAREVDGASGIAPADPAGEAFFEALATGMGAALAAADDADRFSAKFEEVVPGFGDEVAPPTPAGSRRVLLVDDNTDIRMLVRIGIEWAGAFDVVDEAGDGREAVAAVSEGCPDAVLLDLAMPVMDGFEALPLLRARCAGARIVVFSADGSAGTRSRVAAAGADLFLRKDAAIADVVAALQAAPTAPATR